MGIGPSHNTQEVLLAQEERWRTFDFMRVINNALITSIYSLYKTHPPDAPIICVRCLKKITQVEDFDISMCGSIFCKNCLIEVHTRNRRGISRCCPMCPVDQCGHIHIKPLHTQSVLFDTNCSSKLISG